MNKKEFLDGLQRGLSGFPQKDVEQHLSFYEEMIDDRIEEGFSEEDAVADIGSIEEVLGQIVSEIPLGKIVKEKMKNRPRLRAWEIVLLILGAPIWGSLLIAALAIVFSLCIALWSVVISLWAIEISLWACIPASAAATVIFISTGYPSAGMAMTAAGLICAGLSIFLFFGCRAASKGMALLTKYTVHGITHGIKRCFIRKEIEK